MNRQLLPIFLLVEFYKSMQIQAVSVLLTGFLLKSLGVFFLQNYRVHSYHPQIPAAYKQHEQFQ